MLKKHFSSILKKQRAFLKKTTRVRTNALISLCHLKLPNSAAVHLHSEPNVCQIRQTGNWRHLTRRRTLLKVFLTFRSGNTFTHRLPKTANSSNMTKVNSDLLAKSYQKRKNHTTRSFSHLHCLVRAEVKKFADLFGWWEYKPAKSASQTPFTANKLH